MNINYKNISIFGSTGSIGTQTLEVIDETAPDTNLIYLSANKNIKLLEKQAIKYNPDAVIITDKSSFEEFKAGTKYKGKILFGEDELINAAGDTQNDLVISAIVGFSGVMPAYTAIKNGINLALANKEALVSAGEIISREAKKNGKEIIPIDSEHSAIYQCMAGENIRSLEKIILTASGGPFRNLPINEFPNITLEQALNHPNWSMGNKITIDSATMMNKGFEVIEAVWLFDLRPEQIDVVIHPQSIVHSLVQFCDGSVKAQLGCPDMKLPIAYALSAPKRNKLHGERIDLAEISELTFTKPDLKKFRCLALAFEALKRGGNTCTILNAANDISVNLFLERKITFTDIPKLTEKALNQITFIAEPSVDDVLQTIEETKNCILTNK